MTEISKKLSLEPLDKLINKKSNETSIYDSLIIPEKNNKPALLENTVSDNLKNGIKKGVSPSLISFVGKNESASLGKIDNYSMAKPVKLSEGINYQEYIHKTGSAKETVRAISINPQKLNKLNVDFSRTSSLNFNKAAQAENVLVVMNGTFMTGTGYNGRPAGDIKGNEFGKVPEKDLKMGDKSGSFTVSENTVISNLEQRYTFAIDKNNKPVVFKGGIDNDNKPNSTHDSDNYRVSISGGVLLFDKATDSGKKMYNSVASDSYVDLYKKNNDKRITGGGQGGEPSRVAPRSALGVMPDGSVVMVNASEGKYRRTSGAGMNPSELAKVMKQMGCVTAVMFDGGGAPVMIAKDAKGNTITHTTPHESDGYANNKSMIILNK